MTAIGRLVAGINRIVELIVVAAYVALVADISAAVFFRYVLNDSLMWGEELARYIFVWLTFLGAGLGVGRNVHVGVDSVVEMLPLRSKLLVQLAVEIAVSVFLLALIAVGLQLTMASARMQTLLLGVSVAYVYLAVPVGGAVMLMNVSLHACERAVRIARGEGASC